MWWAGACAIVGVAVALSPSAADFLFSARSARVALAAPTPPGPLAAASDASTPLASIPCTRLSKTSSTLPCTSYWMPR